MLEVAAPEGGLGVAGEGVNAPAPMVFMSYRRGVTSPYAGRLEDAINRRFGNGTVFIDSNVEPAVDFVDGIKQALRTCRVMLVVIGPKWAALKGRRGPRLSEPGDFVRLEVETGLRNPEMTVIPLLVKGARMPHPDQLPASLRGLPNLNGLELSERLDRWNDDVGRLLKTLERLLPENCSAHGTGTVPDFPSTGDLRRSAIAAAPRPRGAAPTSMPLPPPLARRGRPRLARGLWVAALVAAVGAMLGLLTNVLDLRDRLLRDAPAAVTMTIGRDPQVNIWADRWAERHPSAFGPGMVPEHLGVVYSVQLRAEGLEGETATLRWYVRDDFTRQAVEPVPWAPTTMPFEPDGDPWQDTVDVFVAIPDVMRMRVVFTVVYDDDVIATGRTAAFTTGGGR